MTQYRKERMFLELNGVLVKFWIEQGRPAKEIKIELLERMLNCYKKMGYCTLDKQEEDKLPEGVEEVAMSYYLADIQHPGHYDESGKPYPKAINDAFIAGAEYQRKQDQQLIELAEDHAMLAGMNKMKEEMMEKAVAVEVVGDKRDLRLINSTERCLFNAKRGDWLKVIVIPEEK